jgi:hypothetical protein
MTANNQRIPINSVDDIKNIQSKLKTGDSVAFKILRAPQAMGARGAEWQPLFLAGQVPAAGQ